MSEQPLSVSGQGLLACRSFCRAEGHSGFWQAGPELPSTQLSESLNLESVEAKSMAFTCHCDIDMGFPEEQQTQSEKENSKNKRKVKQHQLK
mmetsp:Transcript_1687/g.3951  ORF Transcript_1687/g.3951 Transcript_1687/m.3951 type:complete len:92 (+) Transcript_1687:1499-1774(+)